MARARRKLLARERESTHLRDAVNAERRRLPMVKVEKDYTFEGPDGEVTLLGMFEGRSQLYIHHFMWIDAIDAGCPSCTAAADLTFTEEDRELLHGKDVTFACVSRAPYASIAAYRDSHGWTFPWYSSRDGDFTYDYHVTLDPARAPIEYNYKSADELRADGFSDDDLRGDWPGASVFLRRGGRCSTPTRRSPAASTTAPSDTRSSTSPRTGGRNRGRTRRPGGRRADQRSAGRWGTATS